jgi:hypothetical protein
VKKLFTILVIGLLSTSFVWAQSTVKVINPNRADKSLALRNIIKTYRTLDEGSKPRVIHQQEPPLRRLNRKTGASRLDPAFQNWRGLFQPAATLMSFEGLSNQDNINVLGFPTVPPDPNGDVGPAHYVQMINLVSAVFDKTGNLIFGPFPNNALWDGYNRGDPIVLYDPLADRWLLTQMVTTEKQCVACSETGDPTGAYFRYEFDAPGNDYPKHGVWPDAYTFTYKNSGVEDDNYIGALERDKILIGDPTAQIVLFPLHPTLDSTLIFHVLPVDLDGPPPSLGTPSVFVGHQDDTFTGSPEDRLALWELNVDWTNPDSSTLDGPFFLPTDPFDMSVFSVPQPYPGELLDVLPFNMMHRLVFRDFGSYMAMVVNHTVDVGDFDNHAGIRWYELRNEGSGWSIFQQGTYAPDSDHRWMGSIAMDAKGYIALGYSVSGEGTFPSIRYTGHTANAPLGEMNVAEQTIMEGSGSQIESSGRWGDYSMLVVDPVDNTTFWYTNEYYQQTSSLNFHTRIGSFNLEPSVGNEIQVLPTSIDFGVEVLDQLGSIIPVAISNIGDVDLTISVISDPGDPFILKNLPELPLTIPSFGSESFEITFEPTLEGSFSSSISIISNDPDNIWITLALTGESVDLSDIEALIWDPTSALTVAQVLSQATKTKRKAKELNGTEAQVLINNQTLSSSEIAAALNSNGVSNRILPFLVPSLPPNIHYLFVVAGQWPTNIVISDPEAITIENYITSGGHVYIEGGEVWFSDPRYEGGHNFGPTFGINAVTEGAQGELSKILGYNIAADQDFAYTMSIDNRPDHIEPIESAFLVHTNEVPLFGCGVANPLGGGLIYGGRTIGTSFEFSQLIDGASPVTKIKLMANYIDFFKNGFALGQSSQILVTPDSIDFRLTIVGDTTAPLTINIQSVGTADLTVSNISYPSASFVLDSLPTVPIVIPANNFESFEVIFSPTDSGVFNASISIESNDGNDPIVDLDLSGEGVYLTSAKPGVCYATLGYNDPNAGSLIIIDVTNGSSTMIGPTHIISSGARISPTGIIGSGVPAVAIKSTGEIYATDITFRSGLWRVDAATGTSILIATTDLVAIPALAFNEDDVLYAADLYVGNLYIIDDSLGTSTLIGNTGINVRGLAFDPIDGTLWASVGGHNAIYTIDVSNAAAKLVGNTGISYGKGIPDLSFDKAGNLYSSIGGGTAPNYLISIDKSTGAGTIIGPIGFTSVSGIAMCIDTVLTDIYAGEFVLPTEYTLHQNYPNPFNPTTTISYSLPKRSKVVLTIYNLLGQEVKALVNEVQTPGNKLITWDARDNQGDMVGAGVYIYTIRTGTRIEARKMVRLP